MLFAVKNRLALTLLLLVAFAGAALAARRVLGLGWNLLLYPGLSRDVAIVLFVLVASDGLLHGVLGLLLGERYRVRFDALADYFRPQSALEIAASGLLAGGGEELVFRGVLLQALLKSLGAVPAIGISAVVFGALHILRDPRLAPFGLWAVWQGILLGTAYVATGSLLLTVIVHAAHDWLGFALLALRRRGG